MSKVYVEDYDEYLHYNGILQMKLREADRQELLASTGSDDPESLVHAANTSDIVCYVYLYDNRIIALSGASHTHIPSYATVWAMGTDAVIEHWKEIEPLFTKHVNAVLDEPEIEVIGNIIDLRNEAHIRWIKKLGFTMTGVRIKLGGYKFESFYKRRNK